MEEILLEILKELKLHTSLLESFCQGSEDNKDAKKYMMENMAMVKKMMLSNPAFKDNPEHAAMISNMFKGMPGG